MGCNNYGLGTWFEFSRLCSIMLLPEHFMIFPVRVHMFVQESLCRTHLRIRGPKLVSYEGSFKKGLGQWGHSIRPGPKAHMGLGISEPYISPPLIHTRLLRRIKELAKPFDLGGFWAWDSWLWLPINAHLKRRAVSRHQVQLSLLFDSS